MASWYFVKQGERNGPVSRTELAERIADGTVQGDTLVWTVGLAAWTRADNLEELGVPRPSPLPPPLPTADAASAPGESGERVEMQSTAARAEQTPVYAGFWVRGAAKILDALVLVLPTWVVERSVVALWFDGRIPDLMTDFPAWLRLVSITAPLNLLIAIAYSVYFITRHEATPGKRWLGLRVVREDGGRVGGLRVVGRYFAEQLSALVFFVGYVMAAFDEEKRSLHDYLCRTRVVCGQRSSAGRPASSKDD